MKLDIRDGQVEYYVKSGKHFVMGKMNARAAKNLTKTATKSDEREGYEIKAGDYYFKGVFDEKLFEDDEKKKRKFK